MELGNVGRFPPPMHSATLVPLPANTTAANNFARPPQPGNSTVGGYPVEYDALLVYGGLGRYAFFVSACLEANVVIHAPILL